MVMWLITERYRAIDYQGIGVDSKDGDYDTKDDKVNNTNYRSDSKDGDYDTKDDKVNRVICKHAVDYRDNVTINLHYMTACI